MPWIQNDKEVFVKVNSLAAGEVEKLFSPLGYFTARLNGEDIRTKAALMAALAAALSFPPYFGRNWDALLDCLRSLPESIKAGGYALIVENSGALLADSPAELQDFREIAGIAAEFLMEKRGIPLKVIML